MNKKPSYVDSLNAIANGERGGHALFTKWAEKTKDAKLRAVLERVAVREAEHSWAFEKRLNDLGYPLRKETNAQLAKLMKVMASSTSDEAKFNAFGIGVPRTDRTSGPDRLLGLLADSSIDPLTGALLGRFICEERDSGRLLVNAHRSMLRRVASKRVRKKAA